MVVQLQSVSAAYRRSEAQNGKLRLAAKSIHLQEEYDVTVSSAQVYQAEVDHLPIGQVSDARDQENIHFDESASNSLICRCTHAVGRLRQIFGR